MVAPRARRPGRCVVLALTVVLTMAMGTLLAGCGTASPESPPSGIDELEIPTPSPDPGDFVAQVDNPWLPLTPGASWIYDVSGATSGTLTVTVRDAPMRIAGVDTTAVERLGPDGTPVVDYYAQDRAGNVWWFGREGEWQAGADGAEAGVAMPADPRLGDGWRAAYAEGVVDVVVTVATTDQAATTPAGRFTGLVGLDTESSLTPEQATRSYYAEGVGLVEEVSTSGPVSQTRLVSAPS
ncbi:MAG TPA: hypothetical protein PLZ93_10070 [Nocardioides sp.]|uniref:hypothetical protein n=1 Tax=uncultured Nocardioides sp. TaxID=198441 RepID=UPI0026291F95|nr:hypothetical protein [uncultured Nocardioides sp.]HRI95949.1 hypothetical protein [Nocardioides sp.]